MVNRNSNSVINLFAALIAIFTFLTGINSIPDLFSESNEKGIFIEGWNISWSIGLLIISQVALYISLFIIIRTIVSILNANHSFDTSTAWFILIISVFFGSGISFIFMEGYWGPITQINYWIVIAYGIISVICNLFTSFMALKGLD